MEHVTSVVIGAGTAGLGAAGELQRRGVGTVVLEAAERAGEPWRGRYDGLRLNSARLVSGVRGAPMPWSAGTFPDRDTYADYLSESIARLGVDVRFGIRATRIEPTHGGYVVQTS